MSDIEWRTVETGHVVAETEAITACIYDLPCNRRSIEVRFECSDFEARPLVQAVIALLEEKGIR